MSPAAILTMVCGQEPDAISQQHGSYIDWFQRAMGPAVTLVPWSIQDEPFKNPRLSDYAGMLITGSPASLTAPEPWMEVAIETIRAASEGGTPVLGVCFGHQLIGSAFGAPTVAAPDRGEHGCVSIELSELGKEDKLFVNCPASFLAPATHFDQVDPECVAYGNGLRVLATSSNTAVQALAAGKYVRGVQFHPEFNAAIMASYLRHEGQLAAEASECAHATRVLQNWIEHFCH